MKNLETVGPIATITSRQSAKVRLSLAQIGDQPAPQSPAQPAARAELLPSSERATNRPLPDSITAFLRAMAHYPLLTAAEEVTLARQVRLLISAEAQREQLTQALGRPPQPSELATQLAISVAELEQRCHQGQIAKRQMICSNLRLVISITKRYRNHQKLLPDLIQEGVLGLNRAVERFDPERGYRFSTYAYGWVHQYISQAIAHNCHTVRLPCQTVTKLNKIKQIIGEFQKTLGRSPTEAELAKALEVSPRQLVALQRVRRHAISLNYPIGEEEKTELVDLLEDPTQLPEEQTAEHLMREEVRDILDEVLTRRERDIVFSLYGLLQSEPYPIDKVSRLYNLSPERVRQLQTKAIEKLHRPQIAKRLKSLLRGL
jgi:RNA polymerase sigma factor (sigma-70 family)